MCIAADGDVSQLYCVLSGQNRYSNVVLININSTGMFCIISYKKDHGFQIGNTISLTSLDTIAIQ
jgi:hypothetical protein